MSESANLRTRRFAMLVRWHELQLEQARTERAAIDTVVEQLRREVDALEAQLRESHALADEMVMQATGVSVDALRQLHAYMRWQVGNLKEREASLERTRALAEEARVHVLRRYERLAAIERARDRHGKEAALWQARRDQIQLDDRALARAAPPSGWGFRGGPWPNRSPSD